MQYEKIKKKSNGFMLVEAVTSLARVIVLGIKRLSDPKDHIFQDGSLHIESVKFVELYKRLTIDYHAAAAPSATPPFYNTNSMPTDHMALVDVRTGPQTKANSQS
jgi:hypothetical protein